MSVFGWIPRSNPWRVPPPTPFCVSRELVVRPLAGATLFREAWPPRLLLLLLVVLVLVLVLTATRKDRRCEDELLRPLHLPPPTTLVLLLLLSRGRPGMWPKAGAPEKPTIPQRAVGGAPAAKTSKGQHARETRTMDLRDIAERQQLGR